MRCEPWRSIVVGLMVLAPLCASAQTPAAPPAPAIEYIFPNQLVRGQANVVHVAVPGREMFQAAEITPAAGVTVSAVTNSKRPELSQNVAWWEVTINVARDATVGNRTLVLLSATGRSMPTAVMVVGHAPVTSDLKATPPAGNQRAVDVQLAVADESGDIGEQPYVWFTIACGGEPTVGVVRGRAASGQVRASIPRPAASPCDLEVRASDTQKIDSNTLKTRTP